MVNFRSNLNYFRFDSFSYCYVGNLLYLCLLIKFKIMAKLTPSEKNVLSNVLLCVKNAMSRSDFDDIDMAYTDGGNIVVSMSESEYNSFVSLCDKLI